MRRLPPCLGLLLAGLLVWTTPPRASAQQPNPVRLVQQGRRLNADGRQEAALKLYEQALALQPDLFDAHLAEGIALDLLGRYAEARRHLTRAIELAPSDAKVPALNAMAVSYAFECKAGEGARFYQ